jgi:hypothetical protein
LEIQNEEQLESSLIKEEGYQTIKIIKRVKTRRRFNVTTIKNVIIMPRISSLICQGKEQVQGQ